MLTANRGDLFYQLGNQLLLDPGSALEDAGIREGVKNSRILFARDVDFQSGFERCVMLHDRFDVIVDVDTVRDALGELQRGVVLWQVELADRIKAGKRGRREEWDWGKRLHRSVVKRTRDHSSRLHHALFACIFTDVLDGMPRAMLSRLYQKKIFDMLSMTCRQIKIITLN